MSKVNDLLIFEQLMSAAPATVTPPPTPVDSGPVVLLRSGEVTATGTGGGGGTGPDSGPVVFARTGSIELEEEFSFLTEMSVTVHDPLLDRAPSSVTISVQGATPETDLLIKLDGTLVWTARADSDGNLLYASIQASPTVGGAQGLHTITVDQTTAAGTKGGSATYTFRRAPALKPANQNTDAQPILVAKALINADTEVRKWVLQDLLATSKGGIGSYVLPINPSEMTSPHLEHRLTSRHTTSKDGKFHVSQAAPGVKEWQFSGYCPTEEMAEKLLAYRNLNRRFYLIDHHNRAWIVVFTLVDIRPRLRHQFNGVESDWGSDYTVSASILDQNWKTPA